MPIDCPISLTLLSTEQFAEIDYSLMKLAFETHNEIGRLADEAIYQADFAARISASSYSVSREVPVEVTFHDFSKTYYLDIVASASAIYELKVVNALSPEHAAQLMNYLLLLDQRRGKLVNFRPSSVETKFVNAPMTTQQRRSFKVSKQNWTGANRLEQLTIELLRDWGTGLELSLYQQAITHFMGGDVKVNRLLPLSRSGIDLGQQRFQTLDAGQAFRITAFEQPSQRFAEQIRRLIQFSPIKTMHWINIGRKTLTFSTIS